ncbi:hypothetical protein LguiA_001011 [Lonicera macranthoides]
MLEHIVLVHYRETQELQGSPVMPVVSNSNSGLSDRSASWNLSEESDSMVDGAHYPGREPHAEPIETIKTHEMRLHEINTLEWDELLVLDDPNKLIPPEGGRFSPFEQQNQCEINGNPSNGHLATDYVPTENNSLGNLPGAVVGSTINFNVLETVSLPTVGEQLDSKSQSKDSELVTVGTGGSLDILDKDGLQTQDSFGKWINYIMTDSPGSVYDPSLESSISTGNESFASPIIEHYHQSSGPDYLFSITDVSPAWAFSNEETKILVLGSFQEGHSHHTRSQIFCVSGDTYVPTEHVQSGVFRCLVPPHTPGLVNLYLSYDGHKPISQSVTFEYRVPPTPNRTIPSENNLDWEEFRVKMRLAHLLFSTSKSLNILSTKISQKSLLEAKLFAQKTAHIPDSWTPLIKSIEENRISFPQAKDGLFELILQNRLQEWLLERIVEGCKISDHDDKGQGAIHLCAVLGYTWAVYPFSWSGLSLDYRDKSGWTALHWAAYYGREKMVAALLSAGAKPNLVTDPTSENRAGRTAADLASMNGYDGLAAYLAEKALVDHFKDMTIAGNVTGSLQTSTTDSENSKSLTKEELYLKETLAAYRTAADAAARIQAAIREHSLKLKTKAAQFSNPDNEARSIIAAMKIQHAYRSHETRKKMAAAVQIQYRFRTWKIRKDFINMRRQAIKIQAIFRGFQVRRQYGKIIWSVGVLEKAILRWRLKRKGFRGLHLDHGEDVKDQKQESDVDEEEDFFKASRKQAEERVERSVVRVQAMFRSKRAQEEYRRMKLAHNQATLEYEGLLNPEISMEQ